MEVTISKGHLIISMPLITPPSPSASGKTLLIASTRGTVPTTVTIDGKPVLLNFNATISAK